jgi:two-component system, sensor histidine kinase and response regulator
MNDFAAKARDEQCFNYRELLERVDNDRELMRELLEIFQKDFPRHREELRAAVVNRDPHGVHVIGHILRGMFANLAAGRAASFAADLEQIGNSSDMAGLSEAFEALETESKRLLPILEACREEVCR